VKEFGAIYCKTNRKMEMSSQGVALISIDKEKVQTSAFDLLLLSVQ
jgi:hypothetical protein